MAPHKCDRTCFFQPWLDCFNRWVGANLLKLKVQVESSSDAHYPRVREEAIEQVQSKMTDTAAWFQPLIESWAQRRQIGSPHICTIL